MRATKLPEMSNESSQDMPDLEAPVVEENLAMAPTNSEGFRLGMTANITKLKQLIPNMY